MGRNTWEERSEEAFRRRSSRHGWRNGDPRGTGFRPELPRAELAAAPTPASAPVAEALDLKSQPDAVSCRAALPGFSATLARGTGDVEQALISRGSCRLLLGQREAGLGDLRDYLTRFPQGRFVARARALLSGAVEH